jgi:hypothetical protein
MRDNLGRFKKGSLPWNIGKKCEQTSGELHPNWKGGRFKSGTGYVFIKSNHRRSNQHGYIFEHILVAENKIGRELRGDESVHHVNGVRDDNRSENLVVLTKSNHRILHGTKKEKNFIFDKEFIEKEYLSGKSIINIAKENNSTVKNVITNLLKYDITINPRGSHHGKANRTSYKLGNKHPNWKGGISKNKSEYLKMWRHSRGISKKYK